MFATLYSLNHAVERPCCYLEAFARRSHSLMVERVDEYFLLIIYIIEHAAFFYFHGVRRFRTVGILRVSVVCRIVRDVLVYPSAERHSKCLHAAADAQHRNLPVERQSGYEQFGQVAHVVDVMQRRRRLLISPQRIEVAAACEQQSVDSFERIEQYVAVCHWRNEHGRASCLYNLTVVAVAHCSVDALVVCCYAYNGSLACLRLVVVEVGEMLVQIK